ncbi:M56 family metallopeptidase [Massilia horti]|uniref:Peptidase M56 domain-containing protein n=1 Tax=Massilia horti TaxID=2562153 RepID=A0A4Y9SYC8_9BURK|nr:M56 family metallopeptidase [Massilia horti]TFW31854.1 hypothetical protein E4O92_12060 [Massilia horti]
MANSLISTLATLTWTVTIALLLVLALRWVLGRLFGAALAYQVWFLVPILLAVALMPEPVRPIFTVASLPHLPSVETPAVTSTVHDWSAALVAVWLAGVIVLANWFVQDHRRYVRKLGRLTERAGLYFSDRVDAGPALLGLRQARLIVPKDFLSRYSTGEQQLIIEHERVHACRGDVWANLFQAALQCAFWFNPLIHFAALLFRGDQELACDAAVVQRHSGQRRVYAEALLKAQTVAIEAPPTVACHWQPTHLVKERIMSLQQAQPSHMRRIAGRFVLASVILSAMSIALAARTDNEMPANAKKYNIDMKLVVDGQASTPRFEVSDGGKFAVRTDANGKKWAAEFVVSKASQPNSVYIAAKIDEGGKTVAKPSVLAPIGQQSRIRVDTDSGPFDVSMVVTELAR